MAFSDRSPARARQAKHAQVNVEIAIAQHATDWPAAVALLGEPARTQRAEFSADREAWEGDRFRRREQAWKGIYGAKFASKISRLAPMQESWPQMIVGVLGLHVLRAGQSMK